MSEGASNNNNTAGNNNTTSASSSNKRGHHHHDIKTPVWQVLAFKEFVKTILISELVTAGNNVLDIFCGPGVDVGKWDRAKVKEYVGVDTNQEFLKEANQRWLQKKMPFKAKFLEADPFIPSLDDKLKKNADDVTFDVVSCFEGMQNIFQSEARVRSFLGNVSTRLNHGGFFFGVVPDGSEIWYKAQKVTQGPNPQPPSLEGTLFSIGFPREAGQEEFPHFGSFYTFRMGTDESHTNHNGYLIHFPSLMKIARELGLVMLEITNFLEFYEDNRKTHQDKLKTVLQKEQKLMTTQHEIISLFALFVFVKEGTLTT